MTVKYHQRENGEWIEVEGREHRIRCCDCGLVHRLRFRVRHDGHLEFQAFRLERPTSRRRTIMRRDGLGVFGNTKTRTAAWRRLR